MTQPSKSTLPRTDSISELAAFWDSRDLTEFEGELEEVANPFRSAGDAVTIPLDPAESDAISRLAASEGKTREQLLHDWVQQQLARHGRAS